MNFLTGLVVGSVVTIVVYHFGLQPLLQKWRDDAVAKAKDEIGKNL